ncbi:MAG: hypothetical protein GY703_20065 [Gammaproteobacteria bacterium]|nr:hypothetical protein [Gammaproteobacteria bacterium]
MFRKVFSLSLLHFLAFLVLGLSIGVVSAAPGVLSQAPLYLTAAIKSNIFFVVDDSGSMDWEVLLPSVNEGVGRDRYLDFTPNDREERRLMCAGYNVMAYDPNLEYTPWSGKNSAGTAYGDMPLNAAKNNPYVHNSSTRNLNSSSYYVWTDLNNNGVFDNGECGESDPDNGRYIGNSSFTNEEKNNFANWYSYYRKREHVAKRALSEIIYGSTTRMGLATLHNNNGVGTPIADMTDITTNPTKKERLLDELFQINSTGGTPLRSRLEAAGKYYESGVGSPLFSSFKSSPVLASDAGGQCQQNFTVLMSDGYWNSDSSWSIGNKDGDNNTDFDSGVAGPYGDSVRNTLADAAMHYYERDLKSYPNRVPTIPGVDEQSAQHMVTFTVAFGLNGALTQNPTSRSAAFAWPTPSSGRPSTVDDMRHAAWNGRGQFLSAGDPEDLIRKLNAAISTISEREGTAAAVSFNSTSLQTNTLIYQAQFNSDGWNGDLMARSVDLSTNPPTFSTSWSAADKLDARDWTNRKIITSTGAVNTELSDTHVLDFTWSNLTQSQKLDLCAVGLDYNFALPPSTLSRYLPGWSRSCTFSSSGNITASPTAQLLVDYLKGDDTNEGASSNKFRGREGHKLGDIVHSGPKYVGVPSAPYPNFIESATKPYFDYRYAQRNRPGRVYIGSNDGMLHVYNSSELVTNGTCISCGDELFAYIPGLLFSTEQQKGLHYLAQSTNPNTYNHAYYVDLSPNAADAFVDGSWRTYLLGGLRGGGKGIFAMDITDPNASPNSQVKWEFTHNNLGYTFSEIKIARMNNGKWAAILGNGYNSTGDGKAQLFIIYLDGSNLSNPKIISTNTGSIANSDCEHSNSECNGLSSPAIADLNKDGTTDRIYAGDLQGNLWVFDVSGDLASSWDIAYKTGATPEPLFTTCTSSSSCYDGSTPPRPINRQPITTAPALARHNKRVEASTKPNLMVFVGTGQYVANGDNSSTDTQSFYGIWDSGQSELNRSNLVSQTITESIETISLVDYELRSITGATVNYDPNAASPDSPELGWYIDLPTSKERVVVSPSAIGTIVLFNTMIPSVDACSGGGDGWLMSVNQSNGGEPAFEVIDLNGDGITQGDSYVESGIRRIPVGVKTRGIPTASKFLGDKRVTATSNGNIKMDSLQVMPDSAPKRMSWTNL